jgi:hypothetical protein
MSKDAKSSLRGFMKAPGAILRFLNKECTQSTVLGVKYVKLINIIFTGDYEFDDEPEMDEELATEGIASLNIRQQTMVMAYKSWSKLKSSAIRETYYPQLFSDLMQTIEEANMIQIRSFDSFSNPIRETRSPSQRPLSSEGWLMTTTESCTVVTLEISYVYTSSSVER